MKKASRAIRKNKSKSKNKNKRNKLRTRRQRGSGGCVGGACSTNQSVKNPLAAAQNALKEKAERDLQDIEAQLQEELRDLLLKELQGLSEDEIKRKEDIPKELDEIEGQVAEIRADNLIAQHRDQAEQRGKMQPGAAIAILRGIIAKQTQEMSDLDDRVFRYKTDVEHADLTGSLDEAERLKNIKEQVIRLRTTLHSLLAENMSSVEKLIKENKGALVSLPEAPPRFVPRPPPTPRLPPHLRAQGQTLFTPHAPPPRQKSTATSTLAANGAYHISNNDLAKIKAAIASGKLTATATTNATAVDPRAAARAHFAAQLKEVEEELPPTASGRATARATATGPSIEEILAGGGGANIQKKYKDTLDNIKATESLIAEQIIRSAEITQQIKKYTEAAERFAKAGNREGVRKQLDLKAPVKKNLDTLMAYILQNKQQVLTLKQAILNNIEIERIKQLASKSSN
jgi:hypothetical protein